MVGAYWTRNNSIEVDLVGGAGPNTLLVAISQHGGGLKAGVDTALSADDLLAGWERSGAAPGRSRSSHE